MKLLWTDRRMFIAFYSIAVLAGLNLFSKADVVAGIVTIAMTVAGTNAVQAIFSKDKTEVKTENNKE